MVGAEQALMAEHGSHTVAQMHRLLAYTRVFTKQFFSDTPLCTALPPNCLHHLPPLQTESLSLHNECMKHAA